MMTMPSYIPPAGYCVGLTFTQLYSTPTGYWVGLELSPGAPAGDSQYLFVKGEPYLQMGAHQVRNAAELVFPGSASSGAQIGTATIANRTQEIRGAGNLYSFAAGAHSVWLYTRYLTPPGTDTQALGEQWASHFLRHITAVGAGDITGRGTPWVSHSPRELAPSGFDAMKILESHTVGGTRFIQPEGTEMTQWGSRIVPEGQVAYPPGFAGEMGMPGIQLHTQYVQAKQFETNPDDLRFGRQEVWNLRQIVQQDYDANDGLNPPPFGQWTTIENRNKAPVTAGWVSERHGYTQIDNKAVAVMPGGIAPPSLPDFEKAGSVTHGVRYVPQIGLDSLVVSPWAAVFNNAIVVGAYGVDCLGVGGHGLENRSREYRNVGGLAMMAMGTPMIAAGVRHVGFESRYSIEPPQIDLPVVKLHSRYVEYVSAGDMGGAGVPDLVIRWTIIAPKWTHRDFVGEPALHKVTPELGQRGANHEEFGGALVRTQWRGVETKEGYMTQFGSAIVRDRRTWLFLGGISPMDIPRPTVTKFGGLPEAQNIIATGIDPGQVPKPVLNYLFARPEGVDALAVGAAVVTANSIRVEPGIGEYLIGEPDVTLKNRVIALQKGIEAPEHTQKPRLSPHTIYATVEASNQAIENHPASAKLHYVDHNQDTNISIKGVGNHSIGHKNRRLYPPGMLPLNGEPMQGPALVLARQYVFSTGLLSQRFGVPMLPGLQVIEQYDAPLSQEFGDAEVAPPPYIGPQYLGAQGFDGFVGEETRVEHFNRELPVTGWASSAMGASKPGDQPYMWQGLRVGELMPTIPEGFNAEQHGQPWVSHRVRDLAIPGFDAFESEYDYQALHLRMKVWNVDTPKPPTQGIQTTGASSSQVGAPAIGNKAHFIRPDGNAEQYRKGAPL